VGLVAWCVVDLYTYSGKGAVIRVSREAGALEGLGASRKTVGAVLRESLNSLIRCYQHKRRNTTEGGSLMSERTLRGSRLGMVSYETERNTELAPRQFAEYICPRGHRFEVPFAIEAEIPPTWECRADGTTAKLVDAEELEAKKTKPARTHWDMLLERRTIPELEEVLAERLALLRERHGR
jgi:hypothetical protein